MLTTLTPAQERPLDVTGTFFTGYYSATSRGDAVQDVNFVPFGARFDVNGFLFSPDLLSFWAQPQFNVGPQASEAGFQGGNGIALRLSLLRKRAFPLTFRYSNLKFEDVYFGSLTQISAYTLNNRTRDLGLTWELKPSNLPLTIIDWGTGSVNAKSDIALIPDYLSSTDHLNVDSRYSRWGWNFDGFAHWQDVHADLLSAAASGATTSSLQQNVTQYQASGERTLGRDSELYFTAGDQITDSRLFFIPVNLTTRLASAHLRLFQRHRWKFSSRMNYSSNLANQFLSEAVGAWTANPGSVAPNPSVLAPFEQRIANLEFNATSSLDIGHGLGAFVSADEGSVVSASFESPISASYFTGSAGLTYSHSSSWGGISGQYSRDWGNGSITGQSGRIQGQSYNASAQHGSPDHLQFEVAVHGTDQSVENVLPASSHSFGVEASLAHNVSPSWRARAGGGWQNGVYDNGGSQFRSSGYSARLSVESPRVQISAAYNDTFGNSLPVLSQFAIYNPVAGEAFGPIPIIPSDFRAMTFTAHSNPVRKAELSAAWTRSLQHLDGVVNNDFELLNIYGTYRFRRVQIEGGYIRSNQVFLNYPESLRRRLYVKISRNARLF